MSYQTLATEWIRSWDPPSPFPGPHLFGGRLSWKFLILPCSCMMYLGFLHSARVLCPLFQGAATRCACGAFCKLDLAGEWAGTPFCACVAFLFSESNLRHSIIFLLCKHTPFHFLRVYIFQHGTYAGAHEEGKMVKMDCRFFQEEDKGGQ